MAVIHDKVIQKFANASFKKTVEILKFIASKSDGVVVSEVEEFWENHEDGRKIRRAAEGEKRVIDNTIRNLLNKLVTNDCLQRKKKGKSFLYTLKEDKDGLQLRASEAEDTDHLIRWALTLSKYRGLPFITELEEVLDISIEDLLAEDNLKPEDIRPYIDFETTEQLYSGWGKNVFTDNITNKVARNMEILYRVISMTKETVEFTYRSFQKDNVRLITHAEPYLLKEHNKRWYLIAKVPNMRELYPFSLDRIIQITDKFPSRPYVIPREFNPKTYWKDCVGVFKDEEIGPQKVSFELKNGPRYNNQKYLVSSPMHPSQKAIRLDDTWMRFEYFIHVGPEVVRQLRQWGIDNLRNIEPNTLDKDVRFG